MAFLDYPGLRHFKEHCDEAYLQVLPQTWGGVRKVLALKHGPTLFPIGTQIYDKWSKTIGGTEYNVPWDVVHHDTVNDSMYLNWHYCLPDVIQFDAPEAIYYADSNGLAAGTYHIDIGSTYGDGWSTSKSIQFTLANALEEGDQIFLDCGTSNANDPTAGRSIKVFAKGSTTAKESTTSSNGTGGTSLGTIGATSAQKPEGQLNAISRVVYGSGRWSQSAIRQYLNSSAAAGSWWEPQNDWDRPPSQHTSLPGFLAGVSEDFLENLEATEIVTALNTVEGYTDTSETTMDKIFLPSLQEWYFNPQLANVEGVDWEYYKELAEDAGLAGRIPTGTAYDWFKKYRIDAQTSSATAWLRSATRGSATSAWHVTSSGAVGNDAACDAIRGCPACIIKKSV